MIRLNPLVAILAIGIVGTAAIAAAFAYFDVTGVTTSTTKTTGTTSTTCRTVSCTSTFTLTTTTKSSTFVTSTTNPRSTSTTPTSTFTSPTTTSTASTCCNNSTQRIGFWLQESDITNCTWQGGYQECDSADPAQLFFNTMFLTPPYPSTVEVMIFGILQARTNNQGCATSSGFIGSSIAFWGDLAKLANAYPNIRLIYEIAFDPSNGGSGTYGLSCFNSMVQAFGAYPSVYGLGVEGEYTFGITNAQMQTAMSDVSAVGKVFVSYYIHGAAIPSGGYIIAHTNFPAAGDQVGTLGTTSPVTIGLDSGYYYSFPFPQNAITCPIGTNIIVTGSVEGWNQCVVSTELSKAVSLPAGQRQFLELDPGFSSSGSFTGVSGQSTNQLWDNPTLRNWIWTDPNYQLNFTMSN